MTSGQQNEQFVRLFAKHQRRLYAFVMSLVFDRSVAEEIFQDTCVVLWQKFDEFEPDSDFRQWAFRIAHLNVLKWRRQQARRREVYSDAFLESVSQVETERAEEFEEQREALGACLERLKAQDRELVESRYASDRKVYEVAQELGRPANTVYKALQRIRRLLMHCVQNRMSKEGPA